MNKAFQTISGNGKGNCMQAVIASLLDLEIDKVPNFAEHFNGDWVQVRNDFLEKYGYKEIIILVNPNIEGWEVYKDTDICLSNLHKYKGIEGFFDASVASPKYWEKDKTTHALVVDNKCNIVHDPEKDYQSLEKYPMADEIGFNGIRQVVIIEGI
jgi:hypothetical protein